MTEPGAEARPPEPRVSVGIAELDQMLEGGLMPHRPYLLVGPAGTGKTTLALQFLCEGVRRGEKGLYVTVEDPPNEVRLNHRALRPELDRVDVFDAIPDVMRYERVPFKDISAVRHVIPFGEVPDRIRQTPEFTSVEVTGTALEQMLRSEVQRHGYRRLVVDSLTALQYFCMKGFDPVVGAQTFLRFLTDLRTTSILTVEAPLEDVEGPERMLARGEVRLFRWELDNATVRAIGVEKFRGSGHDVRLHPYRLGPKGVDIQLAATISRDTRRIVEPAITVALREEPAPPTVAAEPLALEVEDLVTLGIDVRPVRSAVEGTLAALRAGRMPEVTARVARISAMALSLAPIEAAPPAGVPGDPHAHALAWQRVVARAERARGGIPPTRLPNPEDLARDLEAILTLIPAPPVRAAVPEPMAAPPAPEPTVPEAAPQVALPAAVVEPRPTPVPTAVEAPAPRSPAVRFSSLSEPPPLPTIARRPAGPAAAPPITSAPAAPAESPVRRARVPRAKASVPPAPALSVASSEPAPAEAPADAAPPRRRRRTPSTKTAPAPIPAGEPGETAAGLAAEPKPRRRTVRRKKAPPVVGVTPVVPPEETSPPPTVLAPEAPTAAPPTPENPTSSEGA